MAEDLQLNEFIRHLRGELQSAALEGGDANIRFLPKSVKVELTVSATKSGEGGVNFKIFGIGAEASGDVSASQTQKLTLELEPVAPDGSQTFISDDSGTSG